MFKREEKREINAKIVYFGASGAGTTANLEFIHRKLKEAHRGEITREQQGKDKSSLYEILPVKLGKVRGYDTSILIHSVPGAHSHGKLRQKILNGADGVVFVADLRPDRHDATVAAAAELREHIHKNGQALDDLLLLIQYNQSDCSDENALDAIHRRLGLEPAATFEAVASEGTGVLQTLTSVSKLMLARLRRETERHSTEVLSGLSEADVDEAVDEALPTVDISVSPGGPEKSLQIESAGPAEITESGVELPIHIIDPESGRRLTISLTLNLDVA